MNFISPLLWFFFGLFLWTLGNLTPNTAFADDSFSFYSRIDDAGDSLANELTTRHLQDFPSFQTFGKNCRDTAPWLDNEPIDEKLLQEVSLGNATSLMKIAQQKNITLTSSQFNQIVSCLTDSYKKMKAQSGRQQESLETAGTIGIYSDGDTDNSDFDIMDDIRKINMIIFTKEERYDGLANPTNASLKKYLRGGKAPNLLGEKDTNTSGEGTSGTGGGTSGTGSTSPTEDSDSQESTTSGSTSSKTSPWEGVCYTGTTTSTGISTDIENIFTTPDFIKDLNDGFGGGNAWNTPSGSTPAGDAHKDAHGEEKEQQQQDEYQKEDSKKDFFHKPACDGFFCITFGIKSENMKVLGGGKNDSIETILDKHIQKVENISWSDLSGQKMTNNSFQIPFLNIKFANKIAGARVYIHNKPQITKRFADEDTPTRQEARFDTAQRCAMIDQRLSLNELQSAGVTGAGFIIGEHTTQNIQNARLPLNALDKERLSVLNRCQDLYKETTRARGASAFSSQLGEIQAFTRSLAEIIGQILDTEVKLDSVKTQ